MTEQLGHAVIPGPARFEAGSGEFVFRSGTPVAHAGAGLAPSVESFCREVARRTGLRLAPVAGDAPSSAPAARVELASRADAGVLPAPGGVSPAGDSPPDERYSLEIGAAQVVLRAEAPAGVARGLTTLLQLLATAPPGNAGEISLPGARIVDGPAYAWRGLSLDAARAYFTPDEIRRVIDLLALYKLNVLHLHLTDDQSWRLPMRGRAESAGFDSAFYSAEALRELVAYAAERFVTIVPEVDTPGHASALAQMRPELRTGRNEVEFEMPPGQKYRTVWLDPELPATFALVEEALAVVAGIFPGPYIHIGGDEPFGMPHDLYASYVGEVRRLVRSLGRRPLGWQETARAGLGQGDIIQYWLSEMALPPSLPPELRAQLGAHFAMSRTDIEAALAAQVPVLVSPLSHCYLDVPYAEPPDDPAQVERQGRAGLQLYPRRTVAESFDWEPAEALGRGPAARVAGVEAAIWSETIASFDDLSFLLLPRLAGVAQKAWGAAKSATWAGHRHRLARHGRLWAQDDLAYFRTSAVAWG